MLYFPARQAWDHRLASALLDIPANGFAVAGLYRGAITVKTDTSFDTAVTVNVTIYDFGIPEVCRALFHLSKL
jgi:hypothetical protein